MMESNVNLANLGKFWCNLPEDEPNINFENHTDLIIFAFCVKDQPTVLTQHKLSMGIPSLVHLAKELRESLKRLYNVDLDEEYIDQEIAIKKFNAGTVTLLYEKDENNSTTMTVSFAEDCVRWNRVRDDGEELQTNLHFKDSEYLFMFIRLFYTVHLDCEEMLARNKIESRIESLENEVKDEKD